MSTPKFIFLQQQPVVPPSGIEWADWANVLAALIVAVAAWLGLNSWKREAKALRAMKLGEDILALTYECVDVIRGMRSPWSGGHEQAGIERKEGESDADFSLRRGYEPTFSRYRAHQEKFATLQSLRYRAAALFTQEHRAAIEEIQRIADEIMRSANMGFMIGSRMNRNPLMHERNPEDYERQFQKKEQYDAVVWGYGDEEDTIEPKLVAAKDRVEQLFRPIAADGEAKPG